MLAICIKYIILFKREKYKSKQAHPYHLVEPSPWPLAGAISGLVIAVGAIMFMHKINLAHGYLDWRFFSNSNNVRVVESIIRGPT